MYLQHSAGQCKHTTGLGILTLTFMLITNSSAYSGLLVRINMLSFLVAHICMQQYLIIQTDYSSSFYTKPFFGISSSLLCVELGRPPEAHQASLPLPLHQQGGENTMKSSWVKIRTGRLCTNYHPGQNRLDSGKII